jgi:serine/threonine-protein kinase
VERTRLVGNVVASALLGLHAAHEVTGENNRPLGVVHRDFSPQNIVVGVDGAARVLDFGVAKAAGQTHHTDVGKVKGKIRYLAPEQVTCGELDRRTDLWAASVVLWEALTGRRLFSGEHDASVLRQVLDRPICSPRDLAPEVPEALAQVVMRGLSRDRQRRFATALEMATALEQAVGLVAPREVGAWVERLAHGNLEERRRALAEIEAAPLFAPRPSLPENATITDTAMVRVSSPEPERPTFTEPAARRARLSTRPSYDRAPSRRPFPRATALAWGAAATLVVAIGGGVGGRLLSRMPVQIVVTPAAATLPSTTLVDTLVISAEPMGLSPAPEPTVETAALPVPSASARALPSHRARPALSRTRGAQVTAAPPETPKPPAQPVASTPVDLAHAPFIGRE